MSLMDLNPIGAVLDLGSKLIERLIPDKTAQEQLKLKLLELQQNGALAELAADTGLERAQMVVNQAEAANKSIFVAGWRPAVGWVCAAAFGYQYVIAPLASFVATLAGHPIPLPHLDLSNLMPILLGMLGLGFARTAEKIKGVNSGV